ncbi:hypothetical protein QYF61_018188 [Mycteria americana]|uniref:ribonuclease H n=1 Tax=Mycteria americana TaxID=33587 RepID=A0AAN7RJH8_MYCAM|nr:hypothetical protein QYF61_018188 [Mycteria americana]
MTTWRLVTETLRSWQAEKKVQSAVAQAVQAGDSESIASKPQEKDILIDLGEEDGGSGEASGEVVLKPPPPNSPPTKPMLPPAHLIHSSEAQPTPIAEQAFDPRDRWEQLRREALKDGEAAGFVFPVRVQDNRPNDWTPFQWDLIKELRKTVITVYGLNAPFTQSLLGNVMTGHLLTPYDSRQVAAMILTPTQRLLWEQKWKESCEVAALSNLGRQAGDPLAGAGIPQLMGTDPLLDPRLQARLDPNILRQSAALALQAMLRLPEVGKPEQSFTSIRQGLQEPYMQFIDRLRDALDKQIENREAKEALILKLAVENANTDCKKLLQAMPVNSTLVQMIEACNRVGSIEHHTAALAGAFTAALKIGQRVIGDKRCYRCHTIGHLAADCPQRESAVGRSTGLALGQQVSFKIQRGRTASANAAGKREAEREAGTRDDTSSVAPRTGRAIHAGLPPKGNDGRKFSIGCRDNNATGVVTMDTLSARTRGSVGLDVATVTDFTLWGPHVQKIPLNVKGPLGQGYSALLLGRSSTTLMGLFVLPGVIDADFTGQIQAMVWTPSPPMFIPRKTRIAQLILFKAVVPQAENCFGSTGPPAIFWATQIATTRPMLTVTLYNPHTSPACVQLPVLIDTGTDVTVLALKDWPRSWPLATPTEGLVGVGGTSHTFQSINSLTIKTQEGSTFTVRPYVTNLPMSLLGRDVMAQVAAIDERPTIKLTWKKETPVWVDQWPLPREKVAALQELVAEQLQQGHITPTTSPWNSPVFIIKKKSGKWRLLHDLRQINEVIEEMGSLQPGLPSPIMIPRNWDIVVIDLKDCFFTIPLHPADAPRFAFSVPKVNRGEPMDRYHWTVLPQGMKNSPTICQIYVAKAIRPVRLRFPGMYIYHYMDDIFDILGGKLAIPLPGQEFPS